MSKIPRMITIHQYFHHLAGMWWPIHSLLSLLTLPLFLVLLRRMVCRPLAAKRLHKLVRRRLSTSSNDDIELVIDSWSLYYKSPSTPNCPFFITSRQRCFRDRLLDAWSSHVPPLIWRHADQEGRVQAALPPPSLKMLVVEHCRQNIIYLLLSITSQKYV